MRLKNHLGSILLGLQSQTVVNQRLTYALHKALRALGFPGVLALILLVLCATTWATTISGLQKQLLAIEGTSLEPAIEEELSEQQRAQQASELAAYRDTLPETAKPAILLGKIHGHAEQSGLRPTNTDFQIVTSDTREKPSQLASVVITVDAASSHETLIKFINTVLSELPNSALETISLKRGKLTDTTLETQVRFRFFLRTP